jgi:hypothetical protein
VIARSPAALLPVLSIKTRHQPTGQLPFIAGLAPAERQEARDRRGTRPPMALAYTAFGYFSLMIILALLLPGH